MSSSRSAPSRSARVLGAGLGLPAAPPTTETLFNRMFNPPGFNVRVDEIRLKLDRDDDAEWTCAGSRQYGTDPRDGTPWVALHYRHFSKWADVLRVSAIHFPFELHTWRDDGWVVSTDPDGSVWLQGDLRYRTILHTHWDAMDLQSNYAEAWDVMVGVLAKSDYAYREPMDWTDEAMRALYSRYEQSGRDHRCGSYFPPPNGKLVRHCRFL